MIQTVRRRAKEFCERFELSVPILQAPMAGACPRRSLLPSPMREAWAAWARCSPSRQASLRGPLRFEREVGGAFRSR